MQNRSTVGPNSQPEPRPTLFWHSHRKQTISGPGRQTNVYCHVWLRWVEQPYDCILALLLYNHTHNPTSRYFSHANHAAESSQKVFRRKQIISYAALADVVTAYKSVPSCCDERKGRRSRESRADVRTKGKRGNAETEGLQKLE